ncbi:hypothetical protein HAZT_HAZT003971 [Hyalella azteca]|uniref:Scavenger receptor class B member 1 n=1 Tax=Hyalella azteca TaxID=294128 RepID=A0A6A0HDL3_HYAAZ|nr:hypothetical protein HAZT_HAZT003971 [Hyalella azteca]
MTSASGISNPTFFSGPSDKLSGSEDMTERKDIPYKNLTGTDDDKISVVSDEGDLQCSTSESSLSENSVDIPTAKEREAKSTKRSSSGSDSTKSIKKESSDGKSLENIQDHESVESKKAKKTSSKFIVMMVLSAFTAIFGVAMLAGGYDALFDSILQSDTPVPLTISFYLFNLTNPVEFTNGGRPMVDEIGPYVYR